VLPGGAAGLPGRLEDLWKNGLVRTAVVLVCALSLVSGAAGAARLDPGVSSTSVKIGGTVPLTGVAADGVFAVFNSLGTSTASRRARRPGSR
jgi:hypothetical protein